jgi:hypothetical protein
MGAAAILGCRRVSGSGSCRSPNFAVIIDSTHGVLTAAAARGSLILDKDQADHAEIIVFFCTRRHCRFYTMAAAQVYYGGVEG